MASAYTGAIGDAAAKVGSLWGKEKEAKKMDDKALKSKNEGIDKKLEAIIASMGEAKNLVRTSNKIMELYAPL
jgi:N12 class adenine-specific DNA methylase